MIITPLGPNSTCPFGGTQFTSGATTTFACNGAPGTSSGEWGAPDAGWAPPVVFVGLTPNSYAGNLGGRTGAHGLCAAAFPGSHFCSDWEVDQASPTVAVPAQGAWIDQGDQIATSRLFRIGLDQFPYYTCGGWTLATANAQAGGNLATGEIVTPQGLETSSFVGAANGGCGDARPLTCCAGGTATRFAGYTPQSYSGNLGGRLGANALCSASFPRSHFCADWEYDQGATGNVPPTGSAWIDEGNDNEPLNTNAQPTRFYHLGLDQFPYYTCGGWTLSSDTAQAGGNLATGGIAVASGLLTSSFDGGAGGCGEVRPVACCF